LLWEWSCKIINARGFSAPRFSNEAVLPNPEGW